MAVTELAEITREDFSVTSRGTGPYPAMKKLAKRLSLDTHTIRPLTGGDLSQVQGGTGTLAPATRQSGPSVIAPITSVQSGTSVMSGTSVISAGGGH